MFKKGVTTEWACWQDSDDYSGKTRLQKLVSEAKRTGKDVIFSTLYFFNGKNPLATRTARKINVGKFKSLRTKAVQNNTNTGTALFNRKALACIPEVVINHGGWDTLWHFKMIAAKITFGYVDDKIYFLRRHPGRIVYRKEHPNYAELRARDQITIWHEMKKLGVRGMPKTEPGEDYVRRQVDAALQKGMQSKTKLHKEVETEK